MKDLTGNRYGKLVVIKRVEPIVGPNGRKVQRWLCKCDCGNECIVRHGNLTAGTSKSCGCIKRKVTSERKLIDITGNKYGELTVLRRANQIGAKRTEWLCRCSCGKLTTATCGNLKSGNTTSCGCMKNSLAESIIVHWLNVYNVEYEKEKKFPDLLSDKGNCLRFDFAIYVNEKDFFLLEYQGKQHFVKQQDGFGEQQREVTDKQKKEYCKANKIKLELITYKDNIESSLNAVLDKYNIPHDNFVPVVA